MIVDRERKGKLRDRARYQDAFSASSPIDEDRMEYFRKNFNTPLTANEEEQFQRWLADESQKRGRDISKDLYNYDVRGFWANSEGVDETGHGTDRYKKPNHPTFSNESIYHGSPSPFGWPWEGGRWRSRGDAAEFIPSKRMLQTTHPRGYLERFFERENAREINRPKNYLVIEE